MASESLMKNLAGSMRAAWNTRAERDAFHYIETNVPAEDADSFFAVGEERAKQFIDPVLPEGRELAVDIGCGVGRFSRALSKRFSKVVGLDVSDEMIERGRIIQKDHPNISLLPTDGLSYPVETATADFVFSYVVFQHMPSREVIRANLDEVGRVLKPTGTALIHVKHRYKNPIHAIVQHIPLEILDPIKRWLGVDALKLSPSYRGVGPLSQTELEAYFAHAGMTIDSIRDDATHRPAHEYVFVRAAKSAR